MTVSAFVCLKEKEDEEEKQNKKKQEKPIRAQRDFSSHLYKEGLHKSR